MYDKDRSIIEHVVLNSRYNFSLVMTRDPGINVKPLFCCYDTGSKVLLPTSPLLLITNLLFNTFIVYNIAFFINTNTPPPKFVYQQQAVHITKYISIFFQYTKKVSGVSMEEANNNDAEVFVYMGEGGPAVPDDVVRVRVHSSVTIIPENAFRGCNKLVEVELCDGLFEIEQYAFECTALKSLSIPSTVTIIHSYAFSECEKLVELELYDGLLEIGEYAFYTCSALKRLTIPNTVRSVGDLAFCHSYDLLDIHLPDSIESIGVYAFSHNICTTCRIPPNFTRISSHFFGSCKNMFSLELSEDVSNIEGHDLLESQSLRNIAFSTNAEVHPNIFDAWVDLGQLLGSNEHVVQALKHRFDNLPIHKMIYYQSYNDVTVDQLNDVTDTKISRWRKKLNPTGKQQDRLGMTPLHILACSTIQNIELYRLLVEKYPENLMTKDRWGALPLLYAVWGNAPDEIVQFLVESYQTIQPNHVLNWEEMVVSFSNINAQEVIQKLLDMQIESFHEQSIDWDTVFDNLNPPYEPWEEQPEPFASSDTFTLLLKSAFSKRICAIGVKLWRDYITNELLRVRARSGWLNSVKSKLASYEAQYNQLKEATTVLELFLWKKKITESASIELGGESRCSNKKARIDELDLREQCRVNCRADLVIQHVLPYLLPAPPKICRRFSIDSISDSEISESEGE